MESSGVNLFPDLAAIWPRIACLGEKAEEAEKTDKPLPPLKWPEPQTSDLNLNRSHCKDASSLMLTRSSDYVVNLNMARRTLGKLRSPSAAAAINLKLPANDEITSRQLISALEEIDVSALKDSGVPAIAVFDFDNTLMRGDIFLSFSAYVAKERGYPPTSRAAVARELAKRAGDNLSKVELRRLDTNSMVERAFALKEMGKLKTSDVHFVCCAALRDLPVSRAHKLAQQMFELGAKPYKNNAFDPSDGPGDSARDIITTLRNRGVEVYVLSAGLTFLVELGSAFFGIDPEHVFAADAEMRNGVFTGTVPDVFGIGKDTMVRNLIGCPPLFAFGDSPVTDILMMQQSLVRGFMIEPSAEFVAHVKERGENHLPVYFAA